MTCSVGTDPVCNVSYTPTRTTDGNSCGADTACSQSSSASCTGTYTHYACSSGTCQTSTAACNVAANTSCTINGQPCGNFICNGGGACVGNDSNRYKSAGTSCTDGNSCTTSDQCTGSSDSCSGTAITCSASCIGLTYYAAGSCSGGTCSQGAVTSCDDSNPCTTDFCSASGGCSHSNVSNGVSCGTNLACDGFGNCVSTCSANYGQACTKSNACNTTNGTYDCSGTCNAATPAAPPANYGQACTLTSASNNCGDTNTCDSTISCSGACSGSCAAPADRVCNTYSYSVTPSLSFTAKRNGSVSSQNITVSNTGNQDLSNVSNSESIAWASTNPGAITTILVTGSAIVTVNITDTSLAVGSYSGNVSFSQANAGIRTTTVNLSIVPNDPGCPGANCGTSSAVTASQASCPGSGVDLSWTAASGAASYNVFRNTSNNAGAATQIASNVATTFYHDSVAAGTAYYYWVSSVGGDGTKVAANTNSSGIQAYSCACPAAASNPVTLASYSINTGNTTTASAPAGFSGGSFSSSNSAVASVSGSTVTGVSAGTATVSGSGWNYGPTGATGCNLGASNTLTIAVGSAYTVTPSLNFTAKRNGSAPAGQSVVVSNTGNQTLNNISFVKNNMAWGQTNPASPGSITTLLVGGSNPVPVNITDTSLAVGNYTGTVDFNNAAAGAHSATINYSVIPNDPSCPGADCGGSSAVTASQASCPGGGVDVSWTAASGATAYKVFRNTSNNANTAAQIGSDTTNITFHDAVASGTNYYYWVSSVGGDGTKVAANANGSGGISSRNCTCPSSGNAVSLSAGSVNESSTVSASAPAGFSGGSFSSSDNSVATISGSTVTGVAGGNATISGSGWTYTSTGAVNCSLTGAPLVVIPGPSYAYTVTSSISFDNVQKDGPLPATQNIVIKNTGNQDLTNITYAENISWADVNPAAPGTITTLLVGGSATISVKINTTALNVGNYSGFVDFHQAQAGDHSAAVNMTICSGSGPVSGIEANSCACPDTSTYKVALSNDTIVAGSTVTANPPNSDFTGGSFSSSAASVATVSGSTVTGVAPGTSNISGTGWTYGPTGATNCSLGSSALTVGERPPGGGSGSTPELDNFDSDHSVACAKVRIAWTAPAVDGTHPAATGYKIYRATTNTPDYDWVVISGSSQLPATTLEYEDTPPSVGANYWYAVQAFSSPISGSALSVADNGSSIQSSACEANLTSSDKDIIEVNNTAYTPTPCGGTDKAAINGNNFKAKDKLKFQINLCNSKASAATNMVVTDTMTGLRVPSKTNDWNVWFVGPSSVKLTKDTDCLNPPAVGKYSICNDSPSQATMVINLKSSAYDVPPAGVRSVTYEAELLPNIPRFQNSFNISYDKTESNSVITRGTTPLIPLYNGSSGPTINEVP